MWLVRLFWGMWLDSAESCVDAIRPDHDQLGHRSRRHGPNTTTKTLSGLPLVTNSSPQILAMAAQSAVEGCSTVNYIDGVALAQRQLTATAPSGNQLFFAPNRTVSRRIGQVLLQVTLVAHARDHVGAMQPCPNA